VIIFCVFSKASFILILFVTFLAETYCFAVFLYIIVFFIFILGNSEHIYNLGHFIRILLELWIIILLRLVKRSNRVFLLAFVFSKIVVIALLSVYLLDLLLRINLLLSILVVVFYVSGQMIISIVIVLYQRILFLCFVSHLLYSWILFGSNSWRMASLNTIMLQYQIGISYWARLFSNRICRIIVIRNKKCILLKD